MATKRGDKSKHELVTLANNKRREDEYIERLVLSSDTLQGRYFTELIFSLCRSQS